MIHKKTNKKIGTFGAIFLLVSVGLISAATVPAPASSAWNGGSDGVGDGNDLDLDQLEKGDLILTAGGDLDVLIPGKWAHTMIYMGNDKVIEAVKSEDKVAIHDAEVIHERGEAAIFRVNASEETKDKALEFAKKQQGKPYDEWWLDKQIQGESYYCSELAWASYKTQGVNLDQNPGWSWTYANGVAPTELADDDDTYRIAYSE